MNGSESWAGRRDVLPGRSAWEHERIEVALGKVGGVAIAPAFVFGFIASTGAQWAGVICIICIFIAGFGVHFSHVGLPGAAEVEEAELDAGYTTRPQPHRPEVDLVAPRSGIIIRAAGEPKISRQEYMDALERLKGAAEDA